MYRDHKTGVSRLFWLKKLFDIYLVIFVHVEVLIKHIFTTIHHRVIFLFYWLMIYQ